MVPRDLEHQNALAPHAGAGTAGAGQPRADKFDRTGVDCFLHSKNPDGGSWNFVFFGEGRGDLFGGFTAISAAGKRNWIG